MSAGATVLNGRYRLDHLVGRGGFARVYLGTDLVLRRYVAVKVLNADLVEPAGEVDFLARFAREAQAVAALDHPNILGIHDYGQSGGVPYLVMPYVDGGSLDAKLRAAGCLSPEQAFVYLRQAAAALDYAHAEHRLVHRDIKPQNLLLRARDDRLLLADFGIAKALGATASAQSRSAAVGTLSYMAPEQFQGRVVPATDVYALGCVLFQLLAGAPPYEGTTEQVMYGHVLGPIPALAAPGPAPLPAGLPAVLARALAKRPEERFPSAGALAEAFGAALDGGAASPAEVSPAVADAPTVVVVPPPPRPSPTRAEAVPASAALERDAATGPDPGAAPPGPPMDGDGHRVLPAPAGSPAPPPAVGPTSVALATPALLSRGAGLALVAGGLLWLAAVAMIVADGYVSEERRPMLIASGLLVLAGLGGFLARHGPVVGRAGRVGLLLTGSGLFVFIGGLFVSDEAQLGPLELPWDQPSALLLLLFVGGLLFVIGGVGVRRRDAGALAVGGLALFLLVGELYSGYFTLPIYQLGRLLLSVGLALLAVALPRTGALPRWGGRTLLGLVGASALLAVVGLVFAEGNPAFLAWSFVAVGLAWIALGAILGLAGFR